MSRKLSPTQNGESTKVAARVDAALLAVIDREAERLARITGEECDRSKALRSIVRQFAHGATAHPEPRTGDASSPTRGERPPREGKPRARLASNPPVATSPDIDPARNATVRGRLSSLLPSRGVSVRSFCARYEVTRSTAQRFLSGGDVGRDALDKIAAAVDALAATATTATAEQPEGTDE